MHETINRKLFHPFIKLKNFSKYRKLISNNKIAILYGKEVYFVLRQKRNHFLVAFSCGINFYLLSLNRNIFFIHDVLTISISEIDPILLTIKSISTTAGEKPKSGLRLLS